MVTLTTPKLVIVEPNTSFTLSVSATGTGSLSYQWRENGRPLTGETGAQLSTDLIAQTAPYWFDVDVTDSSGTTRSETFFVRVSPAATQIRHWGEGLGDKILGPASVPDVVRVAMGSVSSQILTLQRDGTLTAWPWNNTPKIVPEQLVNVVDVAVTSYSAVALKHDGSVEAWGYSSDVNTIPEGLNNVVALAAGNEHVLALKNDGTVVAWGGSASAPRLNIPENLTDVVAVAGASNVSVALKSNGEVVVWGWANNGEDQIPEGLTDVVKISAQVGIIMALKSDGTAAVWGNPPGWEMLIPEGLTDVIDIHAAWNHAMALKADGSVVVWGRNDRGALDVPADLGTAVSLFGDLYIAGIIRDASQDAPPSIQIQPTAMTIAEESPTTLTVEAVGNEPLSYQWSFNGEEIPDATDSTFQIEKTAQTAAGTYTVTVTNHRGAVTSQDAELTVLAIPVVAQTRESFQVAEPGGSIEMAVAATGTGDLSYQWYFRGHRIPGAQSNTLALAQAEYSNSGHYWVDVTDNHGTRRSPPFFARISPVRTKIVKWGQYYQSPEPDFSAVTNAVKVSTNGYTTLVLTRDGRVEHFGNRLGNFPEDLENIVDIEVGGEAAAALRSDGTVVAWGTFSPSAPAGLAHVVDLAVGRTFFAALRSNGSVTAWEGSFDGEDYAHGVVEIGSDWNNLFFLREDGLVGSSSRGAAPVALDRGKRLFSSGRFSHFVQRSDGSLVGWGDLRDTYLTEYWSDIREVSAGENHVVALLNNGAVVARGVNSNAQTDVPLVAENALAIEAYGNVSLAICADDGTGIPALVTHPQDVKRVTGSVVQMEVQATGQGPLEFRWQVSLAGQSGWADLATADTLEGATRSVLFLRPDDPALSGNRYRCRVSNGSGSTYSDPATLWVRAPLVVTPTTSVRQLCHPGDSAALGVSAQGQGTLHYQWWHNGRPLEHETQPDLQLPLVGRREAGWYVVDVTDDDVVVRSETFFVLFAPAKARAITWGSPPSHGTDIPDDLTDIIAIAGGNYHPVALRADGTLLGSGSQRFADVRNAVQLSVPTNSTNILLSDGTVTGWGHQFSHTASDELQDIVMLSPSGGTLALNRFGQVETWRWGTLQNAIGPSGLNNVVAVTGRDSTGHQLVLLDNGKVYGWGWNTYGETDIPEDLEDVIAIAAGDFFSVALKSNGTVEAWGINDNGEIDVPPDLANVVSIAAGGRKAYAIKDDGGVVHWGQQFHDEHIFPDGLEPAFQISTDYDTSFAVSAVDLGDDVFVHGSADQPNYVEDDTVTLEAQILNAGNRVLESGDRVVLMDQTNNVLQTRPLPRIGLWTLATVEFTLDAPAQTRTHTFRLEVRDAAGNRLGDSANVSFLVVEKLTQEVFFDPPTHLPFSMEPISLLASADSGLPIEFHLITGNAVLENGTLRPLEAGTVGVEARQTGDSRYAPATSGLRIIKFLATYESWQQQFFPSNDGQPVSNSAPADDPDNDDISNLVEYALGLNPHAYDVVANDRIEKTSTGWTYSFDRPGDRSDITYAVEYWQILQGWQETSFLPQLDRENGDIQTWRVDQVSHKSSIFFRLRISRN
ncbi:MAG: hypothetical protein SynsKO_09300 [Synoicihabitans sp.]